MEDITLTHMIILDHQQNHYTENIKKGLMDWVVEWKRQWEMFGRWGGVSVFVNGENRKILYMSP